MVDNDYLEQNSISPEDIRLFGSSGKLETVYEGSDAAYSEYRAQVDELGTFYISSIEGVKTAAPEKESQVETEAQAVAEADDEKSGNQVTGAVTAFEKRGTSIATIVLAVLLGVALSYIVLNKLFS